MPELLLGHSESGEKPVLLPYEGLYDSACRDKLKNRGDVGIVVEPDERPLIFFVAEIRIADKARAAVIIPTSQVLVAKTQPF